MRWKYRRTWLEIKVYWIGRWLELAMKYPEGAWAIAASHDEALDRCIEVLALEALEVTE